MDYDINIINTPYIAKRMDYAIAIYFYSP